MHFWVPTITYTNAKRLVGNLYKMISINKES